MLNQAPYNAEFSTTSEPPINWWQTIFDNGNQLQRFAIKLFSVSPHSASCERQFSSLGWIFGDRRQRLKLESVKSLGKVQRYILSNTEKELNYFKIHDEEYIKNLMNTAIVNNEDQYDDDLIEDSDLFLDDGDIDNGSDSSISNITLLNVENIVDLGPWVVIDPTFIPQVRSAETSDEGEPESDFDINDLLEE